VARALACSGGFSRRPNAIARRLLKQALQAKARAT
jgi:hypothetical protein